VEDYSARIKRLIPFEIVQASEEFATDKARDRRLRKETARLAAKIKAPVVVFLDSSGKLISSGDLADWLQRTSTDVDFILGGPHGCEIPNGALRFSLGKMTLPHELARVVLLEQIYRALTVIRRLPYHK
jgi:23S rRNA (pseudouridine1915-N3)-methyltransferase